jgi:hypothetical protein
LAVFLAAVFLAAVVEGFFFVGISVLSASVSGGRNRQP